MADSLQSKYIKYIDQTSSNMIGSTSIFNNQVSLIEKQFNSFGLTNEQFSEMMSQLMVASAQSLTQYANSSTLNVIELEQKHPLVDADLELKKKDLELKDQDIKLKDKDLELRDKELALKDKELLLKSEEILLAKESILKMAAEIAKLNAETAMTIQQVALIDKQIITEDSKKTLMDAQAITEGAKQSDLTAASALKAAQTTTEGTQNELITSQKTLVDRQITGYGDNLIIKAGEYQGGLASFAVNAGSDDAGDAITAFQTTISEMKARAV